MVMVGWALWCLARPGFAEVGTAQVIQVEKLEVVLNAGRREGLALDAEVNLLRLGSPIVHPLTGQVLGRPQEPVGMARVFEVGDHQSRAVLEKSYSAPQVGDAVEYERSAAHAVAETAATAHGHEAETRPPAEASGKTVEADGEVQQRLKELEQSVEAYHTSSKTLKAYPVFAQRVWDEISSMKSYLVSMDERLVQLEEQQNQDRHHLTSVLGGDTAGGEEGMREFIIRYAPDTQVKLKVAGKTLVISVDHDSLRVQAEGAGAPAVAAGTALEPQSEASEGVAVHSAEPEVATGEHEGESAGELEAAHGAAEIHLTEGEAAAQLPWHQSPWMLIGILPLGLVVGLVSWLIKRRYEEKSEELEADYLEDEDEEEEEDEDED